MPNECGEGLQFVAGATALTGRGLNSNVEHRHANDRAVILLEAGTPPDRRSSSEAFDATPVARALVLRRRDAHYVGFLRHSKAGGS